MMNESYVKFMLDAYERHETNGTQWNELSKEYTRLFHDYLSPDSLRKRSKRMFKKYKSCQSQIITSVNKNDNYIITTTDTSFEQYNQDGTLEASKETTEDIINKISSFKGDKSKILNYLGYNDTDWELLSWRITRWDVGNSGTPKFAIKYKISPKTNISNKDILNAVREAINDEFNPLRLEKTIKTLDSQRLMEIPPVELHLGKIADKIQTGEEYNFNIAQQRFYDIFEEVLDRQDELNCDKCLLVIGSDFFNSESNNCTSVHQIPQQNNSGYIKMFTEGIKMYKNVLLELRKAFNSVDVMLCAGNHARAMETFLYIALEQAFCEDSVVHFIENYKQTQCYEYGDNAIFYNHGDANLKQIIKSIPAEFGKEWGSHKFRELHLGHLHKEVTVDDEGGMITRRVGSPCSTDAWHAENRYVGAVKKHEIFIWNKKYGLEELIYIPIT